MRRLVLSLACAAAMAAAWPASAELPVPVQDRETRREALLKGVASWKVMVPEAEGDVIRKAFLPDLLRIEREAGKPEAGITELEKQFTLWKNLFLSEMQAAGKYQDPKAFLELQQERMKALVVVNRLDEGKGAENLGRIAFWKSRINGTRDSQSLRLLFDNMRVSEHLVDPQSAGFQRYSWGSPSGYGNASPGLRPEQAGEPPAPNGTQSVMDFFDWERAKKLASRAVSNARHFMGLCYGYVQKSLSSILPSSWRSEVKQASAYQFASSLNANPRLFDKYKLRRVPASQLPNGVPPVGSIVVYGRGQCGFSPEHGHIEIVVSHDPLKACSDGCMPITPGRLTCIQKRGEAGQVSVYIPVQDALRIKSEPMFASLPR